MPALALTDHGNLYGTVEFYKACTEAGIKPIIGMEAYVAPKGRLGRESTPGVPNAWHLTLLVQNETGYRNLLKLTSLSFLEGYYYKPRMDKEILREHHEGLMALSGCLQSEVAQAVLHDDIDGAARAAVSWRDIFGEGNFYLEVMDHGLPEQKKVANAYLSLSEKLNMPLVVTNDCHYLSRESAFSHEVLLCVGTGTTLSDPKRMRYGTNEFYYKSPDEMQQQFSSISQALENTLSVSEKCNMRLEFGKPSLPVFPVPEGHTPDSYLRFLCEAGLKRRYAEATLEARQRLNHELSTIEKMGYASYFLIVWDFIRHAKERGIPVGPGRGSGAGSLVAYCLNITDICPLRYGLIFERFLNPERKSLPDLDIDFSDEGRGEVIHYVQQKYGQKSVAQIITFGSLKARLAVRDVGRVLGVPLAEVNRIAALIPGHPGAHATIASSLETVPELAESYKRDETIKKLLDVAQSLEGLKRHAGVHAAGIVVAKGEIIDYVPVAQNKEIITTQYEGESLVALGLLKMDFLGLRNLAVIANCVSLVERERGVKVEIENIPLDDKKTFALLSDAKSIGTFQMESSGMRDLLKKIKPKELSDIIALISLYRPGVIKAGMLDEFVARAHGHVKVRYDHPILEPILKETYGCIVYQEQVMRIAVAAAGFSGAQADTLRSAMGKKHSLEMERAREVFLKGAHEKGLSPHAAEKIFNTILHFGGYGFNKSHAAAYALVAYRTAYLKANRPLEYMTALLTSEIGRGAISKEEENKVVQYIREAEAMGLEILPPDINKSFRDFAIESGKIRFGLLAIKNVGEGAIQSLLETRTREGPFRSLQDFLERVDLRQTNRKVLESLIKAGAFDSLHSRRDSCLAALEEALLTASSYHKERVSGQIGLFGEAGVGQKRVSLADPPLEKAWQEHELLSHEKEVLGFYLTGHPLARFSKEMEILATMNLSEESLQKLAANGKSSVRLAGMVANTRRKTTKSGETMLRFRLEDLEGEMECIVFPRSYASGVGKHLSSNQMVVVSGRMNRSSEPLELIVEEVLPFKEARKHLIRLLEIHLNSVGLEKETLERLKDILGKHPGKCHTEFHLTTPAHGKAIISTRRQVELTDEFIATLERLLGPNTLAFRAD